MSAEVYRNAFRYIAKTYFTQPNYYKAPTRLPNGSRADCCFFSLYQVCSPISLAVKRRASLTRCRRWQPEYVANGDKQAAVGLMDEFRQAAESVGQCLHL